MDYNILVNVKYKNVIQTNYDFKQQDYGQKLIVSAEDYDITGTTARLFINKSDGTIIERIMIKENNSYKYTLDAQDTSCAGKTTCDIKYYKQGIRDSSASFIFNIISDRSGKLIESGDFSDSISNAIERCDQAISNIQVQANQAIQDVENALLAELNIYDGFDITSAGYAADARQLNENIANTYAAKIKAKIDAVNNKTDANTEAIGDVNNNLLLQTLTPIMAEQSNYTVGFFNVYKKSGWCFIKGQVTVATTSTALISFATNVPVPEVGSVFNWTPSANGQNVQAIGIVLDSTGLRMRYGETGKIYQFELSYPCS